MEEQYNNEVKTEDTTVDFQDYQPEINNLKKQIRVWQTVSWISLAIIIGLLFK